MSTSREKILGGVHAGLNRLQARAAFPDFAPDIVMPPDLREAADRWDIFKKRIQMVNGMVLESARDLADLLRTRG